MSLYWQWPLELHEDLHFAVYLINEKEQEILLGTVTENNLGKQYFLDVSLRDLISAQNNSYFWQVRLEQQSTGKTLTQSEIRTLNLT
jgi:hypothetical protein